MFLGVCVCVFLSLFSWVSSMTYADSTVHITLRKNSSKELEVIERAAPSWGVGRPKCAKWLWLVQTPQTSFNFSLVNVAWPVEIATKLAGWFNWLGRKNVSKFNLAVSAMWNSNMKLRDMSSLFGRVKWFHAFDGNSWVTYFSSFPQRQLGWARPQYGPIRIKNAYLHKAWQVGCLVLQLLDVELKICGSWLTMTYYMICM